MRNCDSTSGLYRHICKFSTFQIKTDMAIRRQKSNKNPPVFSHEFIIQNHADIVSCIAMIFIIGLMFQTTSPLSSLFITLQHNVTVNATEGGEELTLYMYGMKDLFTVSFYLLITIVVHAVIQEYVLDKVNRKLHLSKVKHSKFNESGQLLAFYAASAVLGIDIAYNEGYLSNINSLWEGYPHAMLPFLTKFYFIIQIAYWIHCVPELYFQKIKKDEMAARVQYAALYLAFILAGYLLNLTRVALILLVLHYTVEFVFHLSRILYFSDKTDLSSTGFMIWNVLFVLVRLGSITLAVLTFWHGLEKTGASEVNFAEGNFNVKIIRINCLVALCLLQAWMMWNFITFQQRRARERAENSATSTRKSFTGSASTGSPTAKRSSKRKVKEEGDSVTQNGAAQRSPKTSKKKQ